MTATKIVPWGHRDAVSLFDLIGPGVSLGVCADGIRAEISAWATVGGECWDDETGECSPFEDVYWVSMCGHYSPNGSNMPCHCDECRSDLRVSPEAATARRERERETLGARRIKCRQIWCGRLPGETIPEAQDRTDREWARAREQAREQAREFAS